MSTVLVDENNPQGKASEAEKADRYVGALEHEKAGYQARLDGTDDPDVAKRLKARIAQVDEQIAAASGQAVEKKTSSRSRTKADAETKDEGDDAAGTGEDDGA